MSGRKPMSSMRSASSRTTNRSSPSISAPRLIRSSTRPGVPDDQGGALVELLDLLADGLAAVDGHDVDMSALGQLGAFVADLDGQFPGGHQHQGLRRGGLAVRLELVRGSGWRRRPSCRCRSGPGPSRPRPPSPGESGPPERASAPGRSARSSDLSMIGESPMAANPLPGNGFGSAAVSGCSGVSGGRSECGGVLAKIAFRRKTDRRGVQESGMRTRRFYYPAGRWPRAPPCPAPGDGVPGPLRPVRSEVYNSIGFSHTREPTSVQIVKYPHPTLRRKSKDLRRVDAELRKIVGEMFELMYAAKGIGLSANQVDLPYRLFVSIRRASRLAARNTSSSIRSFRGRPAWPNPTRGV